MNGGIVWLASYPKSGNTWLRVLLQNLEAGPDAEPADINRLTFGLIASVRLWLDEQLSFATADLTDAEIDRLRPQAYDFAAPRSGPPLHLKIHDAWHRPDGCTPLTGSNPAQKAIYVVRNPLDVATSYAHHMGKPVDEAIAAMADPEHRLASSATALRRQVTQRVFTWSQHVAGWCDALGISVHVVRYEDLAAAPEATLLGIARFLGWPHGQHEVAVAVAKSSFGNLVLQEQAAGFAERAPGVDRFFRSGRSGDWRSQLTRQDQAAIIAAHGQVMLRFGYVNGQGEPL